MSPVDLTRIGTNVNALGMLKTLKEVNSDLAMRQTRIATGKKLNEAKDDPAGMTLGLKMEKQANHLQQAIDNIGDGSNMLSVAEGGLKKIDDILGKMRVKSEQAANDTMGTDERDAIEKDLAQYAAEMDDIVSATTWNGKKLLNGLQSTDWAGSKITLQTGATTSETTSLAAADFGSVEVKTILSSYISSAASGLVNSVVSPGGTFGTGDASMSFTSTMQAGLSELQTGDYTLRVQVATANATGGGTIQLFKEGDTDAQQIASADTGGIAALSRTINTNSATTAFDLGSGVKFSLDTTKMTSTGAYEINFNYQRKGTYTFDVADSTKAQTTMTDVDSAIKQVEARLQTLGSLQSRLDFKTENLTSAKTNTESAYSRLMDADMAEEQLYASRDSILQSTATSMLSQANTAPQAVLKLFQ